MAAFCYWWRIAPSEYWSLTIDEVNAMVLYANKVVKAGVPNG